ncbi:MAG: TonB-dependent receptor plug domain-containing protein [Phenylobacterium sp.]|uniref:TonB-dependent receptor n=1 Tax=Phenylobacterium sp. TaxID=1871053 RepID=UPI0025DAB386|nr:TonB-dependent receptor [Phenylobacterium sp.]MBI1198584.1 TonB-dependent receptor plug domain-containing protein [Phenylobacterium sp.]
MQFEGDTARRSGGGVEGLLRAGRWAAVGSTALAAVLAAGQASAQDATAASVDEVVVTAQKRAEKLQDVPVAVSALAGKQLAAQRLNKVDDIVSFAPSLQVQSPGGDGLPIFSLRGVSMADFSANQNGPVATYFDEVYRGASALLGVSMFDLERVEVLRGPQGTLYGKNTTGGAVNIISRKPAFETGGELTVGYGNFKRREASGAVNLALSDRMATRFAFTGEKADGWMTNLTPGVSRKLYASDAYAGRLSVLARPTDRSEFVLRVSASYQDPINYGVKAEPEDGLGIGGAIYNLFGRPGYFPTGLGKDEVENNRTLHRKLRNWAVSLHGEVGLPNDLTLTSVSSWDWGKSFIPEDSDGSPNPALEVDYAARARQIAQDLRLTSDFAGPFNFIVGTYLGRERIYNATTLSFFTDVDVDGNGVVDAQDCLANFFVACRFANSFTQTKTSAALYTDLKFALTDQLTLRGGLRYTHDTGKLAGYRSRILDVGGAVLGDVIVPADLAASGVDRFRKNNLSGKIGLDYKTDAGQLFYVSLSRGYRGNAFNAQAFFDPSEATVVKPETLTDLEGGAKLELLDRRLTLNLAAFYYDYRNTQFLNLDNGLQKLVNVPKARIYGGEVELNARPWQALGLRLGLGLLDSEIRNGSLNGIDLRGNPLPTSPHVSLSVGVDWTLADLTAGTVSLHADGKVTSKQYFDVFKTQAQSQKAYGLVNGSLRFDAADHRWGASVWAKNLLDQDYYAYRVSVDTTAENYEHPGAPRTFGATINVAF